MGFARLAEQSIRNARGIPEGKKLDTLDRIAASTFGGALGCWNQPIEVVRVEVRRCGLSLSLSAHCGSSSFRRRAAAGSGVNLLEHD